MRPASTGETCVGAYRRRGTDGKLDNRSPDSAPADWVIDRACTTEGASRTQPPETWTHSSMLRGMSYRVAASSSPSHPVSHHGGYPSVAPSRGRDGDDGEARYPPRPFEPAGRVFDSPRRAKRGGPP